MKRIIIGVVAAICAAVAAPAFAAQTAPDPGQAQTNKDAKADQRAKDAVKLHAQAMTDVPPLLQTAGVTCTLTDAAFPGTAKTKGADGKDVVAKIYEAACQEGMGYKITNIPGSAPIVVNCLALATYAETHPEVQVCKLPANAHPSSAMQPLMARTGLACTVSQARWMGESPTEKVDQYEVGCSEGNAYILIAPRPGSAKELRATSCIEASGSGIECVYFPKDKVVAAISALAAGSHRANCQINAARFVGTSAGGNNYYEVACVDPNAGYIFEVDRTNKFVTAIDCARAATLGGCSLSNVSVAGNTTDNDTYTQTAKQIGLACAVSRYQSLGLDQATRREIVELVCNGRQESLMALLPTDNSPNGSYFNCARAEGRSLKCVLTQADATYALLTRQMASKGKTCSVNKARPIGQSAAGEDFVEVSCADGKGYVIDYAPGGGETVKDVIDCAAAKGIGGGCKLTH